jgi:hypothetical protein
MNPVVNFLICETWQIMRSTKCQLGYEKKKKKRQRLEMTIALKSDMLEKINYNAMIEYFILRNTRRMMLFGRS